MNAIRLLLAAACLQTLAAQETNTSPPTDVGWPREFKTATHTVVVFQPQVEEWTNRETLKLRMAVAVSETGKDEEATYGGLFAEFSTDVDSDSRQVLLANRKVTKLVFADADEAVQTKLAGIVNDALPDKQEVVVSLDRIVSAVALSEQQMRQVEASKEVPPIFVSQEPAMLVMFIGKPVVEPIGDTGLLFATNTNWDVFMTIGATPTYFLRADASWYSTTDPKSNVWQPAGKLPEAFAKLPSDDNWAEVRANLPGKPASGPLKVYYSDRPGELIVIGGNPQMSPAAGAALMYVKNTDADLFLHVPTNTYYFLSSGRWFATPSLTEPKWSLVADNNLPAEFSDIPQDHDKSNVLVSVPGTPDSAEAAIMATIPQRATVNRSEATLEVSYEGDPKFAEIPGTQGVQFALNSNFDVFLVNKTYYCCQQAVWFVAPAAAGPWKVCDAVPPAIYTIPADHPKHNVTYVNVYNSTPTTVETGYTSGYTGAYLVRGMVLFGLGYWLGQESCDDDYWHWHCRYQCQPCWYGYGCRAVWQDGAYYRGGSRWYGPYGGAGRNAVYNPATGGWARSAYAYGPRGSAYTRAAYNPYTNTFGRQTRVTTPYGTGTRGVVSRNGEWARGGTRTTAQGTVGAVRGSQGGAAIGYDNRFGGQGGAVKTRQGDVYVGKNGEIHKLDPDSGDWQTRQSNTWKTQGKTELTRTTTTSRTSTIDTSRRPKSLTSPSATTRPTAQTTSTRSSTTQLDREAYARQRGTATTRRTTTSQRSRSAPAGGGRSTRNRR